MATLRLFNYIYGNYNDQRVADTVDLAEEFDASRAVFEQEDVNVSYNDGLMITLVVNIEDNLIESVNYATITDGDVIRPFMFYPTLFKKRAIRDSPQTGHRAV